MAVKHIHALLIEDDPDDVFLLKECLVAIGASKIKLDHADRLSSGLIQLGSQNYDVLLLDLNLPDSRGLETLSYTVKRFPKIPVVVLSGLSDEAITVEAVRRGAQDYLVKDEISGPLVMRVIHHAIDRKQIEAVLRANETRYRMLVEASPNGITMADMEGSLQLCNQQAARMYGYDKPEAMVGLPLYKLYSPEHRQQAVQNAQKALNEGRVLNVECILQRKDGTQFPAEVSMVLLRNTGGAPTGIFSIARDISERKQAMEAEQRFTSMSEDFFPGITQELRLPLLSLISSLDLLRSGKVSDPIKPSDLLARASLDAHLLLDKLDELSDFSQIERGHLDLKRQRVNLLELIHEIVPPLKEKARAMGVSLGYAPLDSTLFADVDPARMKRVICSVIEDALLFTISRGEVFITAKAMNGSALINVIDGSKGLSPTDCSAIFDKSYHGQLSATDPSHGKVVSLYSARRILEAHGGTLTVSSQLGTGSTFTLTLPAAK